MDLQAALLALHDGEELIIPAGQHHGGVSLTGRRNIRIIGEPGAEIIGGSVGLKLDNCPGALVEEIAFRGAKRHNLFIVRTVGCTVRRCISRDAGGSGILTGHVGDLLIERCVCLDNGEHGAYASEGGDDIRIIESTLNGNDHTGLQINAAPDISRRCEARGNTCRSNRNVGIQWASVRQSVMAENVLEGNGRGGAVLWDDGRGKRWACYNCDLTEQAGAIRVSRGCQNIRLAARN